MGARTFGLLFAGVGICGVVTMLFGIGNMTISSGDDGPTRPATPADAWGPAIFILIGLGVALVRYHVAIDAERRMLVKTVGWGPWVKRTETALATATSIDVCAPEQRGDGSGRHTAIPIKALGPTGEQELAAPSSIVKARKLARRIADALALPIGPRLSGSTTLRPPKDLDLPVAETAYVDPSVMQPPANTRLTVTELDSGIEIRLPMAGTIAVVIGVFVALDMLMFGGFWWFFWRPGLVSHAAESWVAWWFLMAPVLLGGGSALLILVVAERTGKFGSRIRVDPIDGLRFGWRAIGPERIRAIVVNEGSVNTRGLKIVLSTSEFVIASGQSLTDLHWLRALIVLHLRG